MKYFYKILIVLFALSPFTMTGQTVDTIIPNLEWAKVIEKTNIPADSNNIGFRSMKMVGDYLYTTTSDMELTGTDTTYSILLSKIGLDGTVIWKRKLMNKAGISICELFKIDDNGSIYESFNFKDSLLIDTGQEQYYHKSLGGEDICIIKYDSNGNFTWVKFIASNKTERILDYTIDNHGDIILYGTMNGTLDVDPNESTFVIDNQTNVQADFIAKYDNDLNLKWAYKINATTSGTGTCNLLVDNEDNIYVIRASKEFEYRDLSTPHENAVLHLLKMDKEGNGIWLKSIRSKGALGMFITASPKIDQLKNIYLSGNTFWGSADFDTGNEEFIHSGNFFVKYDSSGAFQWLRKFYDYRSYADFAYRASTLLRDIMMDGEYIYAYATFENFIEISGYGDIIKKRGVHDVLLKMDSDLSNILIFPLGDDETFWLPYSFNSLIDNNLYTTNIFSVSKNLDNGEYVLEAEKDGTPPTIQYYIAKYNLDSCAALRMDASHISPVNCTDSGSATISARRGKAPYHYSWQTTPVQTGPEANFTTGGFYPVQVVDDRGCVLEKSFYIDQYSDQNGFELVPNITANNFRSGYETVLSLQVSNTACVAQDGIIEIILDQDVSYIRSEPVPDQIIGKKLVWNADGLKYDVKNFQADIFVETASQKPAGESVCINVKVSPLTGDNIPENNQREYCYTVENSYDPNDKQVFPNGQCDEGFILKDQELTYTIRFQNTGNAPAININIIDTLPLQLELDSFKLQATSHLENLVIDKTGNNTVVFKFSNIMLPDSASYPEESQGYVTFSIYPKTTVTEGTILKNRAGIYFDFNEPIITNYTVNTITDAMILNDVKAVITPQGLLASGGDRYQWYRCTEEGGKEKLEGITENIYQPASSGLYAAEVSYGTCTKMTDCIEFVTTGIGSKESLQMTIYPNPSKGNFTLQLNQAIGDATLSIYHTNGQKILSRQLNNIQQYSLDMTVPSGMYLLQLTESDGREFRQPIQIIR